MGLRILFLALEFETWQIARALSYAGGLGLEEGFRAHGVTFVTLTSPCFRWAERLCANQRFDQVWLYAAQGFMSDAQRRWVSTLAPIRVGLVGESLEYTSDELALNPRFQQWSSEVESWLNHLTHVIAFDEQVVQLVNGRGGPKAVWCPSVVPSRFVRRAGPPPRGKPALFCGNPYGWRKKWLDHSALQGLLGYQESPERTTIYPHLFNSLQGNIQRYLNRHWLPGAAAAVRTYMGALRSIRRICFQQWLETLRRGSAVVNLPHYFKCYSGRVIEGMAAACPVISWAIPARPRTRALFEDGKEILLFDQNDPHHLAAQIRRVTGDEALAVSLTKAARKKLLRFHTTEHRVHQLLTWVAEGVDPIYY